MESSRRRSNGCNQSNGHLRNARRRSRRVLVIYPMTGEFDYGATPLFLLDSPICYYPTRPTRFGSVLTRYDVSCACHVTIMLTRKLFRLRIFFNTVCKCISLLPAKRNNVLACYKSVPTLLLLYKRKLILKILNTIFATLLLRKSFIYEF